MKVFIITIAVYAAFAAIETLGAEVSNVTTQKPGVEPVHEKRSIGGLLMPLLGGLTGLGGESSYSSGSGSGGAGLMGIIGSLLSNRMSSGSSSGGSVGGGGAGYNYNDNYGASSSSHDSSPGIGINLDFGRIGSNLASGIRFGQAVTTAGGNLLVKLLQLDSGGGGGGGSGGYGGGGNNVGPNYNSGMPPKEMYHDPQWYSASPYGGHSSIPPGYGRERILSDQYPGSHRNPMDSSYQHEPISHSNYRSRSKPQDVYDNGHITQQSYPVQRHKPQQGYENNGQGFRQAFSGSESGSQNNYPKSGRGSRPSYAGSNGGSADGYPMTNHESQQMYPVQDNEISNNYERVRTSRMRHSTSPPYHVDHGRSSSDSGESTESSTAKTAHETAPMGVYVVTKDSYVPTNANTRPLSEYNSDYDPGAGYPVAAASSQGETRVYEDVIPGEGVGYRTDASYSGDGDAGFERAASYGGDTGYESVNSGYGGNGHTNNNYQQS